MSTRTADASGSVASSQKPRIGKTLNTYSTIFLILVVALAAGWVFGWLRNRPEILSRPVRLAYLICDFALVVPLGIASVIALKSGKSWGYPAFLFALGAFLFDFMHGMVYQVWDNYFKLPVPVYFALLFGLAAFCALAARAAVRDRV